MTKNYMENVAKILGLELYQPFRIANSNIDYRLTLTGVEPIEKEHLESWEELTLDEILSGAVTITKTWKKKEENHMKETRPLFVTYTAVYYEAGYYDDPPSTSKTEGCALVKFPKPLATEEDFEELQNILKKELDGSPSRVIINNFKRLEHPE